MLTLSHSGDDLAKSLGVLTISRTPKEHFSDKGVIINEIFDGAECDNCPDQCPGFTPHSWRYVYRLIFLLYFKQTFSLIRYLELNTHYSTIKQILLSLPRSKALDDFTVFKRNETHNTLEFGNKTKIADAG